MKRVKGAAVSETEMKRCKHMKLYDLIGLFVALVVSTIVLDKITYDIWVYRAKTHSLSLTDRLIALSSPWWIIKILKEEKVLP